MGKKEYGIANGAKCGMVERVKHTVIRYTQVVRACVENARGRAYKEDVQRVSN